MENLLNEKERKALEFLDKVDLRLDPTICKEISNYGYTSTYIKCYIPDTIIDMVDEKDLISNFEHYDVEYHKDYVTSSVSNFIRLGYSFVKPFYNLLSQVKIEVNEKYRNNLPEMLDEPEDSIEAALEFLREYCDFSKFERFVSVEISDLVNTYWDYVDYGGDFDEFLASFEQNIQDVLNDNGLMGCTAFMYNGKMFIGIPTTYSEKDAGYSETISKIKQLFETGVGYESLIDTVKYLFKSNWEDATKLLGTENDEEDDSCEE
jgi:hypothetical protein